MFVVVKHTTVKYTTHFQENFLYDFRINAPSNRRPFEMGRLFETFQNARKTRNPRDV